ncbi:GntP family permease [Anaerococcus sp. WCA-380-WT-2B]|uniref:GntP family permease n=1 Tax=Anaerococcus porci TaxID=2652269 RepID=A0A6N7VU95_9FIRM|nr:SLC13 family permease [Anaerococcus porci]MSS78442.1 GntP family permease [Anaerococcus porci]
MVSVSTIGALIALVIAIAVIVMGAPPAYGMILGALIGGIVGGISAKETVTLMFNGAGGMSPTLLRIMAAGVLAGSLINSGAADVIAENIVEKLGEANSLVAIIASIFILTAIGVFADVACLTVAPIAMVIAQKTKYSKSVIMMAMCGGTHAGNVMSPNPQAIALSDYFQIPLTTVMLGGIIPAIFGFITTIFITKLVHKIGMGSEVCLAEESSIEERCKPNLFSSITGPIVSIILLALRPLIGLEIDPLIALPIGGLITCILCGDIKKFVTFSTKGLNMMSGVILLLLGTGALSGIIANSGLKDSLINLVDILGLSGYLLAPITGLTMGAATASATAGSTVGSQVFGETILSFGVKPLQAAVMIHAGSNTLDGLPHGSFFHTSAGSVSMNIKEKLKLLPFEFSVGLIMTIVSTIIYGLIGINF